MQFDTLITNANIATMSETFGYTKDTPYGAIRGGAVGIKDGKLPLSARWTSLARQLLTR